jgi:LL-diaminopimelate aminotransferase
MFQVANRLTKLPPYLFARIDKIKTEEKKKGRELISLSIGDPDLPTPEFVIRRLNEAAQRPANHQYPSYWGMQSFREKVAWWYEDRFGVSLNPDNEVLSLIGSKEGIAHIPLAFVNPGEGVLVPDPGYPVYSAATYLADGVPVTYTLREENRFLPDFNELEKLVKEGPKIKLMFINYPNNPTAATATVEFFEKLVVFAKKHQFIVAHDNAYSEIYFDGKVQPSFLEAKGAKEVGVEFHSLSKTFNMTGWRVGFVAGHADIIDGLGQVKTNVDSGIFNACQEAAMEAMDHHRSFTQELREIYQERRDVLVPALREIGLDCPNPEATFYVWTKVPKGVTSDEFVMKLIKDAGIVATPGNGFGVSGEGYVRFTLCTDIPTLKRVAEALKKSI